MSFAEETYEAYKHIVTSKGLLSPSILEGTGTKARLEHWASSVIFQHYEFPGSTFDHVWVLQPSFYRSKQPRKEYTREGIGAYLLGVNSKTKKMKILRFHKSQKKFRNFREPEKINAAINNMAQVYKSMEITSFGAISEVVSYAHKMATSTIRNKLLLPLDTKPRKIRKEFKLKLDKLILPELSDWIFQRINSAANEYRALIDPVTLDFALKHAKPTAYPLQNYSTTIYNFVMSAENEIKREFRRGAINVLAPMNHQLVQSTKLSEDVQEFWRDIDAGAAVYDSLGKKWGSPPKDKNLPAGPIIPRGIVRQIVRRSPQWGPHFEEVEASRYAPLLNAINPNAWPINEQGAEYFKKMVEVAAASAEAFDRNEHSFLQGFAQDLKRGSWKDLFYQRLSSQYKALKTPTTQVGDRDVIARFRTELRGIVDMKQDAQRTLLLPAALLEFEKRGFGVVDIQAINRLVNETRQKLWDESPPSEQFSASSYWHSSRVNFQMRRGSAALISDDTSWKTLFDTPVEISQDKRIAVFVPLKSDRDLRVEADAMKHCVWSYGHYCINNGYHIFSVRNQRPDGERMSTLTLVSDDAVESRPQVRLLQNRTVENKSPSQWIIQASAKFMELLNKGELEANWSCVEENKAQGLRDQAFSNVGYNYRDPNLRSRVIEVYQPLIPRSVPPVFRQSIEQLGTYLGVPALVKDSILSLQSIGSRALEALPEPDVQRPIINGGQNLRAMGANNG